MASPRTHSGRSTSHAASAFPTDTQLSSLCDGYFHGFGQHWQMAFDGLTSHQLIKNGGFEDVGDPVLHGDPEKDSSLSIGQGADRLGFQHHESWQGRDQNRRLLKARIICMSKATTLLIEQALQLPSTAKSQQFSYRVKVQATVSSTCV